MPQIGLLTFHRASNFGACLQAYALQELLRRQNPGAEVTVLDFVPPFMDIRVPSLRLRKHAQRKAFLDFIDERLHLSRPITTLSCAVKELGLDAIVVGSDQAWNASITKENWRTYFLDGVPDGCRRISYAASFGTADFPEESRGEMTALLQHFDRVSCREHSGVLLCQERLGYPGAIQTLDPVLLAGAEFFEDPASDAPTAPRPNNAKTITAALLDEAPEHREILSKLRKESPSSCRAKILAVKQKLSLFSKIERPWVTTVPEWVDAIRTTDLVMTDSFHALCFALLFHRNFVFTPSVKNNRLERITDLLGRLGVADRIVRNFDYERIREVLETKIDYASIDARLADLRKNSLDFLKLF